MIIIQDIMEWDLSISQIRRKMTSLDLPEWYIKESINAILANNITLFGFQQVNSPKQFEIFSINRLGSDCFEISMIYNQFTIGIPERKSHKIIELELEKPIRYKINGKSDFTMTRGKERSYKEYDYVIEWIGKAREIKFLELNKITKTKIIPIDKCKLIDERKILF